MKNTIKLSEIVHLNRLENFGRNTTKIISVFVFINTLSFKLFEKKLTTICQNTLSILANRLVRT